MTAEPVASLRLVPSKAAEPEPASLAVLASAPVMAKALRLLASGALTVELTGDRDLLFTVKGDHGQHEVVRRRGAWTCSCPCRGRCSHLTAAMLVTGGGR